MEALKKTARTLLLIPVVIIEAIAWLVGSPIQYDNDGPNACYRRHTYTDNN